MENEENEKQSEVIDLSKYDSSENSSEEFSETQNKKPKSPGHFLSAIGESLFKFDSPEDRKKKVRNLIIIVFNFTLMFIILGYYFSSNNKTIQEENFIEAIPAEMMGEEI